MHIDSMKLKVRRSRKVSTLAEEDYPYIIEQYRCDRGNLQEMMYKYQEDVKIFTAIQPPLKKYMSILKKQARQITKLKKELYQMTEKYFFVLYNEFNIELLKETNDE